MRDYTKITPMFWIGKTGKGLRGCPEAQIVALYLLSAPQANMLGLYYIPKSTIQHDTGLPLQGACKGLARCIEGGFCAYDEEAEMVWVFEMARFQIGESLKPNDLRVKGIANEYAKVPDNIFLGAFFDKYSPTFLLENRRGLQGAYKPLRSQEQEQEREQEREQEQNTSFCPPVPVETKKRTLKPEPETITSDAFKAFWSEYPIRGRARSSIPESWDAWKRLGCDGRADQIMKTLRRFVASDEWTRENQTAVPGAHRWLNKRKWEVLD